MLRIPKRLRAAALQTLRALKLNSKDEKNPVHFGRADDFLYRFLQLVSSHTEIWSRNNQAYVIFGSRFSYYAFRPIAYMDGIVTGIGFHIGPHQ